MSMASAADRSLEQAVAHLDTFRAALGDAAVDAAVAALRRHARPAHGPLATTGSRLRQVSVLFADVADSTAMLGRASTEDAMDLIGRALQLFADAVQQWGGQVLRYTGDGIKAVFGMQGLREDEAERAVRAGLQILQDAAGHAERVRRELGIAGFGVRIGIHTGPVLLGGGPEAERAAMGHAVHLAARMEQSAPVGRLRVSEATWAQVRGLFVAEQQAPLIVKGHDEPLRTWLVQAAEAGPEPAVVRGVDGVTTPTIGRDDELARLAALHARCVAGRSVGVATVLADAGVGKTRLRQELLRRLDLAEGDDALMQARAHPSSGLQPYGLLRQLLARWLQIRDDLSADDARRRLVEGLTPWLGAEAAQQAPRIGQLIGLDFSAHPAVQALSASALREQAFEALRAALHARAAHTPLLVVLDDLHWADDASLGFVQSLLHPADRPLMLLLLARPQLAERGVAFAPPAGVAAEWVHLRPLDHEHGRALVRALLQPLPDAPESLQALLLQRAEGNPFFLEALVRMLIDDGVIDASTRPWRLHSQRLAELRVPSTLVGVLQARLDALGASELQALQLASIVGPVFWDAALAAIDVRAPAALPRLQQRTLVRRRERSTFAATGEHAFAHALLHDVTYGTVLKAPRREGHAMVARWLSERVSDRANEFLALTAEHYERAGDSAHALEFWDLAHVDAYKRYANEAALQFIDRALAQPALSDPRWRYHLLGNRHEVFERLGRSDEAAQAREQMAAWAETCDDNAMRADVLSSRMLVADHEGRPDEAQRLAERTLMLARRADGSAAAAAALAHGELAWLATQRHEHATVAAAVAAGMAQARVAAGVDRRHLGYPAYHRQLRAIAIQALLQQERYVDVLSALAEGLAEKDGSAHDHYNLLVLRAPAERQLGRLDEAGATAQQMLELAEQTGIPRLRAAALMQVAESALWAGDLDRADAFLAAASALTGPTGANSCALRELVGDALLRRARRAEARAAWQEAQALFAAQEQPLRALEIQCRLALFDHEDGRADTARATVQDALAEAARDGRPHRAALTPRALHACHRVLEASGDVRAAALRHDLLARLDEQLASLADGGARERLLGNVPHWRETESLR